MSKLIISALVAGIVAVAGAAAVPTSAAAADLAVPGRAAAVGPACGCCGCLRVTYDYHREMRSTYGTGFDPRNFDQTQPYYYFGPVRPYPQYWVEANPDQ